MLLSYFDILRRYELPITIGEFLDFLGALELSDVFADKENFYFLSRTILIKDEKNFDKFDRATKAFFDGLESFDGMLSALIPEEWVRDAFKKNISDEEMQNIKKFENLEDLINQFKSRLSEQKKDTKEATNGLAQVELHLMEMLVCIRRVSVLVVTVLIKKA